MTPAWLLSLAICAAAEERLVRRLEDRVPGATVLVEIVEARSGSTVLNAYTFLAGKRYLTYTHPGSGERQELDELSSQKLFDFFRDGSKALLYRSTNALGQTMLYVMRYDKKRFRRAGSFPQGRARDLDGDGRFEIISRRRPLGRFFPVGCAGYGSMADAAWKTEVHVWDGTAFSPAPGKFAAFYASLASKDEAALKALEPEKRARAGDYLGAALTLYFDLESAGRGREGWTRLKEALSPVASVAGSDSCAEQVEKDLRRSLNIPPDW